MKYLMLCLMLVATSASQAAITDRQKAARDLCYIEWRITDKASGTHQNITDIVSDEVAAFKQKGYVFSDFTIDEADFIKVSEEGAEGFRKMVKEMKTPYPEARDFLQGRMMPVCIKNVMDLLDNAK